MLIKDQRIVAELMSGSCEFTYKLHKQRQGNRKLITNSYN